MEARLPPGQQPAQLKGENGLASMGKPAPEAAMRNSHTQRWPRGGSQGPLMSDWTGNSDIGQVGSTVSQTRIQIPPLPCIECVTLGKSLDLSKPQRSPL